MGVADARRAASSAAVLAGILLGGCASQPAPVYPLTAPSMRVLHDVPYARGKGFDHVKQRMNVFVPVGPGPHPVVVFVPGGGWRAGGRRGPLNVYGRLGRRFAERGVLTVVISYRLAPEHKYRDLARDVARAIVSTAANARSYGGDPERIFVMGHSAGAHLAALVGADPRWLRSWGGSPKLLKGVIAISGIYDIEKVEPGMPEVVLSTFGHDARVWRDASPAAHLADAPPPPFLVAFGNADPPFIKVEAERFVAALREQRLAVERYEADRSHYSIVLQLGAAEDPLTEEILKFMGGSRVIPATAER